MYVKPIENRNGVIYMGSLESGGICMGSKNIREPENLCILIRIL